MLHELYEYAVQHELAARPGFRPKRVKAHLMLSQDGRFLGIDPCAQDTTYCPDIGAAANGTTRCNILVEKSTIVLCIVKDEKKDKNIPVKHQFFLDALAQGAESEPLFAAAHAALSDDATRAAMTEALLAAKYKPADVIGFQVSGQPLESSPRYLDWWNAFREQFAPSATESLPRCLITGEAAPALPTVPKVSGLIGVGGHTAGDAFLCFDKDAFQSFGLKKSYNAPVSEGAMTAVNAALTKLIAEAPVFGGAKLLHWYAGPVAVEPADDPILALLGRQPVTTQTAADEQGTDDPAAAESTTDRLLHAVWTGRSADLPSARYYILPLSGANGRMMVRGWYEGELRTLCQNVQAWFDDLRLITPDGKGKTLPPKLNTLCLRLLKPGGDKNRPFDRLDKELVGLLGRLFAAIVQGNPLPDEIVPRTLFWLRSEILRGDNSSRGEHLAYQLLKAWLRRKNTQEEGATLMGEELMPTRTNAAYQCGRLMATYAAIQLRALGDIGTTVVERYYATACTAPKMVLGKLATLSQYHLSKMDRGSSVFYQNMLSDIYAQIPEGGIPTMLTPSDQAEFSLGYYHQRAAIFGGKKKTAADDAATATDKED